MTRLSTGAFRGVRVFVTGHTGFKGSWLCEWLLGEGAVVAGLALPPEAGRNCLFDDLALSGRMTSTFGDIRDLNTPVLAIGDFEPEIVFHLAAQALVRPSYADPVETFATNVMGSVHLLEAVRLTPSVRAVVCVTSDKCYENQEWVWGYRESDPMGGADPYSASKGAAEIVAGCYMRTLFPLDGRTRLATARGGNVIGGGDWSPDRLAPDLVRAIGAGQPPVLRNPSAVRPWQHVLELVRGYLTLGAGLLAGQSFEGAWNFGPGRQNEISVGELTARFLAEWGGLDRIVPRVEASAMHEAQTLRLDISKASALLDWRPILGIDDTVRMTAEWYRQRADSPGSAAELTRGQLESYRRVTSAPA